MLSGQFQRFAVLIAVVCLMYGNVLYSAPAHPETAPDQLPDDILKRNADQTNHVHDPAKDKSELCVNLYVIPIAGFFKFQFLGLK